MNETADTLYAELRKRGQMSVGYHLFHLLPGVRYRAKRDGLRYRQMTRMLGRRSHRLNMWNERQREATFWLEDETGMIYKPDAHAVTSDSTSAGTGGGS